MRMDGAVNGTDLVVKSLVSGMWYSDRWPVDGTGWCYGATNSTTAVKKARLMGREGGGKGEYWVL